MNSVGLSNLDYKTQVFYFPSDIPVYSGFVRFLKRDLRCPGRTYVLCCLWPLTFS
jgi:hypothetical protein